jgi:hypothetical protein
MKRFLSIATVLLLVVLLVACDSEPTKPPTTRTYGVQALLQKNLSTDSAGVHVVLTRNGVTCKTATMTVAGLALDTTATGYMRRFGPTQIQANASYVLNIKDGDSLDVNLTISLPETFAIDKPGIRVFTGSAEPVSWSASVSAAGYVIATVPPNTAYAGYSAYVAASTNATIPPEAFLEGQNRIPGYHEIYVAAYKGSPSVSPLLPFDLPTTGGPVYNVALTKISGRVSGMVIAVPDSIAVPN